MLLNDAGESLSAVQFRELRHRLRNHLQSMTSLISLQLRRAQHPETIQALEDLRARFTTLTGIYVDLDDTSDQPVELDRFVRDLVHRISQLYDPRARHGIALDIMSATISGQRAATLGQIIVELIINVYRHAFPDAARGAIRIELKSADGDVAVLTVADNGLGLREADPDRRHFGFAIVTGLSNALGGTFEHESRGGFHAHVRFALNAPAPREP